MTTNASSDPGEPIEAPSSAEAHPIAARETRAAVASPWLTYPQAAAYTGWTVVYLRNLVSAGEIPVHGRPRVRRFLKSELDSFLTDPVAAMRRFRAEGNRSGP